MATQVAVAAQVAAVVQEVGRLTFEIYNHKTRILNTGFTVFGTILELY